MGGIALEGALLPGAVAEEPGVVDQHVDALLAALGAVRVAGLRVGQVHLVAFYVLGALTLAPLLHLRGEWEGSTPRWRAA